jgi:hypothetical protein
VFRILEPDGDRIIGNLVKIPGPNPSRLSLLAQINVSLPDPANHKSGHLIHLYADDLRHAILPTCKQIHTEARKLWWQSVTWNINSSATLSVFLLARLVQTNVGSIRHIECRYAGNGSTREEQDTSLKLSQLSPLESVLMTSYHFWAIRRPGTNKMYADITDVDLLAAFDN